MISCSPVNPSAPALSTQRDPGAQDRAHPGTALGGFSLLASGARAWGENSPNGQLALGVPKPGWRQSRAVRLACPCFDWQSTDRGVRRDALPYFEVHGEGHKSYGRRRLLPGWTGARSPPPPPPPPARGAQPTPTASLASHP